MVFMHHAATSFYTQNDMLERGCLMKSLLNCLFAEWPSDTQGGMGDAQGGVKGCWQLSYLKNKPCRDNDSCSSPMAGQGTLSILGMHSGIWRR